MRRLILTAAAITVTLVVVALLVAAVLSSKSRAEACRERGGTVFTDVDYTTKETTKNGRTTTKRVPHTEHECVIDGREVDEW